MTGTLPPAPPARISADRIEIRTLRLSESDPLEWAEALSPEEHARAGRHLKPADRDRFRLGRGLLRVLLAKALGVAPGALPLRPDARGKPALPAPCGLAFSVSHSGDLVAVALGEAAAVGIDVERRREDFDPMALALHVMTKREFEALELAEDRFAAFFETWVLKEALLKGMGTGLLSDPRDLDIAMTPEGATLAFAPGADLDRAGDWRLRPLALAPGYHAALAALPSA